MLGAEEIIRMMQEQGAANNPPSVQIGTMTSYNTCMIGKELKLAKDDLYFSEELTMRYARTAKVQVYGIPDEFVEHEKEKIENDLSIYINPLKKGDIVALIRVSDGRYLVFAKVIKGESVIKLEDQIEEDWAE